ncbi:hypothetical protein, partial [Acinetobacter pittii]|uniref:hypothetical protein n=1 Tax=Acinetobacter pittii TaxID=48296 RepID=UPI00300C8C46
VVQGDAELSIIRAAVRLSVDDASSAVADLLRADRLAHDAGGQVGESFDTVRAMVALDQARLAGDVGGARAAAEALSLDDGTGPEVRA